MSLIGLIFGIAKGQHSPSLLVLLGCVLVAALGRFFTRRTVRGPGLAWLGVVLVVVALWLVPQRPDQGTSLVLSFVFGLGMGLVVPKVWRGFWGWMGASWAFTVLLILVLFGTQRSVLVVTGMCMAAGALARIGEGRGPDAGPRSTGGQLWLVALTLIVGVGLFVSFLGASTPDATWFGGGVIHGNPHVNEVALTFDDGPNIGSSAKVARILDEHGVKGTFFMVGKAVAAEPSIARQLYADGQLIGNHSYNHDQWRWTLPWYPELDSTQKAIKAAIGTCPAFYRPPHGQRTPFIASMIDQRHMHMIIWNDSAGDWATTNARLVARRILARVHPGSIILLHDGLDGIPTKDRSVLVRALPLILDGLKAKGLKPVRLDQLLHISKPYLSC